MLGRTALSAAPGAVHKPCAATPRRTCATSATAGCLSLTESGARRQRAPRGPPVQCNAALVDSVPSHMDTADSELACIPDIFKRAAQRFPDDVAVQDPHRQDAEDLTFRQLYERMELLAAALIKCGVAAGDTVCQFADNSSRWLVADQAIMLCACVNAVRGATAPEDELLRIVDVAAPKALVVQDRAAFERLAPHIGTRIHGLKFVMLLWDKVTPEMRAAAPTAVYSYNEMAEIGRESSRATALPHVPQDSVATLVFTSGTTSAPKAAALTHANILYQVQSFPEVLQVNRGQCSLSLLPPWHIYERTVSYYIWSCGGRQVHSSIKRFKKDLATVQPNFLVCVPLLLDTLHTKIFGTIKKSGELKAAVALWLVARAEQYTKARRIMQGVAIQQASEPEGAFTRWRAAALAAATLLPFVLATQIVFKKIRQEIGVQSAVISGGGSLAPHLDDFYEAIGLPVLNGWGMTETAPVIACRKWQANNPAANVRGTVGRTLPGTSVRIVKPEMLDWERADGEEGLLLVRGPGVFKGYWQDPETTAETFHGDYLVTGDLGKRLPEGTPMAGQLVLTGRAKDTIVLSGGENVSPQPIEDALCCSPIIKHAMMVGQDKRTLGVLVSLDHDAMKRYMQERGDTREPEDMPLSELDNAVLAEVQRADAAREGRNVWEAITTVHTVASPFSVENGTLTQTMKLIRPAIREQYAGAIESIMARLR